MRSTRLGLLASSPNCRPTKKRRTSRLDAPIRPCNSSSAKAIPLLRSASLNACGTWPSCSIVVPAMSKTTSSTTLMISSSCLPATFSRHLFDLGTGGCTATSASRSLPARSRRLAASTTAAQRALRVSWSMATPPPGSPASRHTAHCTPASRTRNPLSRQDLLQLGLARSVAGWALPKRFGSRLRPASIHCSTAPSVIGLGCSLLGSSDTPLVGTTDGLILSRQTMQHTSKGRCPPGYPRLLRPPSEAGALWDAYSPNVLEKLSEKSRARSRRSL